MLPRARVGRVANFNQVHNHTGVAAGSIRVTSAQSSGSQRSSPCLALQSALIPQWRVRAPKVSFIPFSSLAISMTPTTTEASQ
ncbi:hypothetical protein WJX73_008932 [Symbiochloris irregularis]|uniref:Uncharacterized protein n=1 Tax=Symbiochloris irregularis TaxID=706552 RepID=A0AAW1NZ15_9CHLO